MKKIVLHGWKLGFKKVSLTLLLRDKVGYSLSRAKAITDAVLAGESVEIELQGEGLEPILIELTDIGVEFSRNN